MHQESHEQAPVQGAEPQAPQRVQMSRSELEQYVRDGRPTGLLLRSVALLKGLSVEAVSKSCGIPSLLVQAIFDDHGLAAVKKGSIKRVSSVLGIDLRSMRFAAGQVHVFRMGNIPLTMGRAKALQAIRAVGLLTRGARVAELSVGSPVMAAMTGKRMFVAQTPGFRALFVGSVSCRFNLANLPSATWVCQTQEKSSVRIQNAELVRNLWSHDLTEGEFDELFQGSAAFTWDDIRVASRVNGVSKQELMNFIGSRAIEIDQSEDIEARRAVIENAPFLRLVENDLRAAA